MSGVVGEVLPFVLAAAISLIPVRAVMAVPPSAGMVAEGKQRGGLLP
ncbi:hypothetical protein OIE67_38975 [Nonomuraea fuscirosea]|nr:hypothetical protein [Nonomuraea fuscirosea]WSA50008.1 hypothetical protein OIE67_38975 [Nonomuraea fuscirosea]